MTITVGIAGITGKFARCIASNLLNKPNVEIRGYCRNPSKLSQSLASRIHVTKGEAADGEALQSFVRGTDVVICAYLGDNVLMEEGQKALIDACQTEKVPRYVASDYSLNYRALQYGQLASKDPMKRVEEYIRGKDVQGVHVLIGIFMETFWSQFFQIWNQGEMKLSYWGTGSEKWESTSYMNAAEYVAAIAMDQSATGFFEFLGDRKNIFEIANDFELIYGQKPKLENVGSLNDLYQHMHKVRDQNPANVFSYLPLFYHYYCTNGQTYLKKEVDNQKYPQIKPVTFNDFLKSHTVSELSGANWAVGSKV